MRALVVHCHPDPESFTASVRDVVLDVLREADAETRVTDLYAEDFAPVLTIKEWAEYLDTTNNRLPVDRHVADVEWCDTLIFVYPTWWYGLPAMLKGWMDRVMLPGSAFHMPEEGDRAIKPGLQHIRRLGVFTTCGASWAWTLWVGAPGKRTLLRGFRPLCSARARIAFAAHYRMDASTDGSRKAHLARVRKRMQSLVS